MILGDLKNELVIIVLGCGISFLGWIANIIHDRKNRIREKKIERYGKALSDFYWPLYFELQRLEYFLSLDIKNRNEQLLSKIVFEISIHIKNNMGTAFPKKVISQPLLLTIPKLFRGSIEGDTGKYISMDSIRFIHSIIEARMITITKKYNLLCGENEIDIYTYAMYKKTLNKIYLTTENEWISPLEWRFRESEYKRKTKNNKKEFLNLFYDSNIYSNNFNQDMKKECGKENDKENVDILSLNYDRNSDTNYFYSWLKEETNLNTSQDSGNLHALYQICKRNSS